jgi:hypothetical protein
VLLVNVAAGVNQVLAHRVIDLVSIEIRDGCRCSAAG